MCLIKNIVQYIDINKLSKWEINPRTIDEKSLEILKSKIKKYSFFLEARPILVNVKKSKPNQLIVFAGNQRLEACKELNFKQVPVVIFNDLTEKEQKELSIIDNYNDGEWKMEKMCIA
jgi:ParB-like chromosome segregation protein Spo0J